jgi:predicted dehydrogenase
MDTSLTRRQFIKQTALATAGAVVIGGQGFARKLSPNDKLNLGIIGVAHRGGENLKAVTGENIVALCDIDANFLAAAAKQFPQAKTYNDYRRLLDQKNIDAVVISTADHTHAVITLAALKSGRHVYCEKPLTHTVSEARVIAKAARKHQRVTQMGTQIHAGTNYRRVVELLQSGVIGPVREVHVWVDVVWEPKERPADAPPVPSYLNYDLWLGPVQYRPYSPEYVPYSWRRWWVFGGGTLADFGCHHIDLSHWGLNLRYPLTIEAEGPPVHPECAPPWLIVRYQYPARGTMPKVQLTWYQGGKRPHYFEEGKLPKWGNGSLFVGEKGMLLADYEKHVLRPEKDFAEFVPPKPFIPDSVGHHREWIEACKTGAPTTCDFDYAGALTEAVLLGNVAYRVGKKLEWNPKRLRAKNCPEADQYIRHRYRKGWKL